MLVCFNYRTQKLYFYLLIQMTKDSSFFEFSCKKLPRNLIDYNIHISSFLLELVYVEIDRGVSLK